MQETGLIEPLELLDILEKTPEKVRLVDASYALPGSGKNPKANFAEKHIGHAVFFDIDAIADQKTNLPHMLPSPEEFEQAVSKLGISNEHLVVIYDQSGVAMAAARAWWMFRAFGHNKVCVLNGGLPRWEALNHPTTGIESPTPETTFFSANFQPHLVCNISDMQQSMNDKTTTILDARSAERFKGNAPEPRKELRTGHIPHSENLPFTALIDTETYRLKKRDILQNVLKDIAPQKQIIASCGSGVTACVIALALFHTGRNDVSVYDGSWSEWGQADSGTPVETSI